MHLIDLYNFKPPAELLVSRDESQAIRVNAAKTSLVRALRGRPAEPAAAYMSRNFYLDILVVSKQLQPSGLVQVVLQQPEGAKQQLCSSWQSGS
jgi:hypothetical protein